jgi:hypothetical protein
VDSAVGRSIIILLKLAERAVSREKRQEKSKNNQRCYLLKDTSKKRKGG